jgi:type IV secretion system protein VirB4
MSLGPVTLSFVGASGKADLARIRALSSTRGQEWPGQWLIERGITL